MEKNSSSVQLPPVQRAKAKPRRMQSAAVNSSLIRRPIQRCFALFLLPTFIAFCIGFLYPFLKGVHLSFCKFRTTSDAQWIGLANYIKALKDPGFLHAFWYTALVAVTSLVLINVLAFAVAYALTRGIRGANIYRSVFFMPNLIGGIVLGYIWSIIYATLLPQSVLLNTTYGFWGLIVLMCWQQIGYMMIIYIAGIQSVSEDMLEAAKIDGANGWHTLTRIIIPTVMPSITICTFLSLTNGFKLFDQNLALTGGDPAHKTEMLALNIYQTFYGRSGPQWKGYGQAKAVLFCILVVVIGLVQLKSTRSKEVQQ